MFEKLKNRVKKRYDMAYENLAVPEIHPEHPEEEKPEENTSVSPSNPAEEKDIDIEYDTVAVPEIHIHRK